MTGPRGDLSWPDAAARFAEEIALCVEYANTAGLALCLEPCTHLFADLSIAHRMSDVVTLARQAHIHVGLDFFCCWVDSDIEEAIDAAVPLAPFVQISDWIYGDRAIPNRAILGDGAIPLERLVTRIMAAGFTGIFDIEVIGPRLSEAAGHDAGLRRCIDKMESLLDLGSSTFPR